MPFEPLSEDRPSFVPRHLGPRESEVREMLGSLGFSSLDELSEAVVPEPIRLSRPLDLHPPTTEERAIAELRSLSMRNGRRRTFTGLGFYGCLLPPVIQRNVLENPGWYTQYTPYQAEIAQGRLEALLNFQTMVADLTGLPLANASLLDEPTAAAEAMAMCLRMTRSGAHRFLAAPDCHPQTLALLGTRAAPLGIELVVADPESTELDEFFGCLIQTPSTDGRIVPVEPLAAKATAAGCLLVAATDLLALTMIEAPGAQGADVAIGSSQRFGMPVGFGGPHAAFLAAKVECERHIPGRIVGQSVDALGQPALRLARQTREQHIRRERATSNICTAQVLPAVVAGMYAVYHGPDELERIGRRVHRAACRLAEGLRSAGMEIATDQFYDTVRVRLPARESERVLARADERGVDLRRFADGDLGFSLDETVEESDLELLLELFTGEAGQLGDGASRLAPSVTRTTPFMQHPVFNSYHSEHEMLRYLKMLEERDLSLAHSMIPLGSCTMKLNATAEMMPITWPELTDVHPYVRRDQAAGYLELIAQLEGWLAEITGFAAVSLQPNAGSQGEYAGLLAIRAYHVERGQPERRVCLIPTSAHGTNPASAVLAGLKVVPVACEGEQGKIDLDDLRAKAVAHENELAALMVTYPSTHGVFEEGIRAVCEIVHRHGGQVYLDGANMNALVGLAKPGEFGADVCHLNLHKTFCIPHGGGGPGMGPICVAEHLAPFLPGDPMAAATGRVGPVSGTEYGSGLILAISWMYIALMGGSGLRQASQTAILNANYMARRLEGAYSILYTRDGLVAHEFILDMRPFKASAGVTVDDVAKRLIDYGFHAPTMSWPVAGTMMVEPTESESKAELDRFCDALLAIREEIREIEEGAVDREDNLLKGAPHTAAALTAADWPHPYSRRQALFPAPWVERRKFWPAVARVDNAFGDRNLVCTCPPVEAYSEPVLEPAGLTE